MKLYLEVTPGYKIPIDMDENDILYDVLSQKESLSWILKHFELTFQSAPVSPFITLKRQNISSNSIIKLNRVHQSVCIPRNRPTDSSPGSAIGTVFRGIIDEMSRLRDIMYNNVEVQGCSRQILSVDTEEEEQPRKIISPRIFYPKEISDEPLPVPWSEPEEQCTEEIDEFARFEELLSKFADQTNLGDIITMLLEQDWEW